MKTETILPIILMAFCLSCNPATSPKGALSSAYPSPDTTFVQDYSIKYYLDNPEIALFNVGADRNGVIQILSSDGLLMPHGGQFLYPGTLVQDQRHRPFQDMEITGLAIHQGQFVYATSSTLLSNAWAGKMTINHNLKQVKVLSGGKKHEFLISIGAEITHLTTDATQWTNQLSGDEVLDMIHDPFANQFWILGAKTVWTYDPVKRQVKEALAGKDFTCFGLHPKTQTLLVGTTNGYFEFNTQTQSQQGSIYKNLPWPELTVIKSIKGTWWFGSTKGTFKLRNDGKFDYYFGERWLPGNVVKDITEGPEQSVLVLTDQGLAKLVFEPMTLYEKAMYFERQTRERHIRYGFNADLAGMEKGDLSTGYLKDSDNDGLWTAMYLGSQVFRYAVTQSEKALANCRESLDAMERLYTINPVPGFPSRSFERSGLIEKLADPHRWQYSPEPGWDWKATTSSDEAIGHVFAFGVVVELMEDETLKAQAIRLLDTLMSHIIKNDLYLVDYDGKPTTWGRWHPDYVNGFPTMVGDRKLNSSNIIGMLQTAWHFTQKEKYRTKAFELMENHGYLENLMRPMEEIGRVPEGADDYSKMLSDGWNHSDDEMYFMGYWGLYRYAFNDSLRQLYKEAILDHWKPNGRKRKDCGIFLPP